MKTKTVADVAALLTVVGAVSSASADELGQPVPPISLVYYAADIGIEHEQSARILSSEWAKLGLDFELQPIQFGTFVATINVGGGLEDMAVVAVGADPDRTDPTYWLSDSSACGERRNASKWCDEEYSRLAALQRTQIDLDERIATVNQAQNYHHEQAPWWPVTHYVYGMVWNSEKWGNITSPAPLAPHEDPVRPWLTAEPLTDDRILDWAYLEDVSGYNPMAEEGAVGWVRFIFDTFAKNDPSGEIVPWAAESWEFTEPTNLRVTLRDEMTFHDGEAVTSDDAVFTLNKVVEVQPPAMASRLGNIENVVKVDDLTFDIQLKTSDSAFVPTALTFLFILPEHIWADYSGDVVDRDIVADNAVIGSGPFKFETWRPNEIHELSTHTAHFAAPNYDGVRRLALGQSDAISAALQSGDGDIATAVLPVAAMSDLAAREDSLDFIELPTHASQLVWVNNEKAPFTDLAFRKALRMATHNQRVGIEAFQGFFIPAGAGPVPNQLALWHDASVQPDAFDIEGARAILEEAGYGWDSQGRLHYPPAH
ncbi:MAG: ABC transporter substrate-binding protein [Pseudomonadota bacterium]